MRVWGKKRTEITERIFSDFKKKAMNKNREGWNDLEFGENKLWED